MSPDPFKIYEDARRAMYAAMEAAGDEGVRPDIIKAGFSRALQGFDHFLEEAGRNRGMYRELEKKASKMRATCESKGGVPLPKAAHATKATVASATVIATQGRRSPQPTPKGDGPPPSHHARFGHHHATPQAGGKPMTTTTPVPSTPSSETRRRMDRRRYTPHSSSSGSDGEGYAPPHVRDRRGGKDAGRGPYAEPRRHTISHDSNAMIQTAKKGTPRRTPRRVESDDSDDEQIERYPRLTVSLPSGHLHKHAQPASRPAALKATPTRSPPSSKQAELSPAVPHLTVRKGSLGGGSLHPSIMSAVTAALPGQSIGVDPGVYMENLSLSRPVTIRATSDGVTIRSTLGAPLLVCTSEGVSIVGMRLEHFGGDAEKRGRSSGRCVECFGGSLLLSGCQISSEMGSAVAVADEGHVTLEACDLVKSGKCGAFVSDGGRLECVGGHVGDNALYGFVVQNGGVAHLAGNRIVGNRHAGVLVHGQGSVCSIKDGEVTNNGEMGVGVQKGGELRMHHVKVANNLHAGVFADGGGSLADLNGLEVSDNGVRGVGIQTGAALVMVHCNVTGNVLEGVFVSGGGSRATLGTGNTVSSNGTKGVAAQSAAVVLVEESTLEANGQEGLFVSDPGSQVTIRGCTVTGNGVKGVGVQTGAHADVDGNLISKNGREGVYVSGGGSRCLVQGNDLTDNGVKGIGIQDRAEAAVEGNRLANNRYVGVHVYGPGSRAILRDNDLLGNNLSPVLTEGGGVLQSAGNRIDGVSEGDLQYPIDAVEGQVAGPSGPFSSTPRGGGGMGTPGMPWAGRGSTPGGSRRVMSPGGVLTPGALVKGTPKAGQGTPVGSKGMPRGSLEGTPPSSRGLESSTRDKRQALTTHDRGEQGRHGVDAVAVEVEIVGCQNLPSLDGVCPMAAFVCASLLCATVQLEEDNGGDDGMRMLVDHNTKSTHTLTKTQGKGKLFKIPPQIRTRAHPQSFDPSFGEAFHITTCTAHLDGPDNIVHVTGQPLKLLLTVHDRDSSWTARASTSLMLSPLGGSSDLLLPLLSASGETVSGGASGSGSASRVRVLVRYRGHNVAFSPSQATSPVPRLALPPVKAASLSSGEPVAQKVLREAGGGASNEASRSTLGGARNEASGGDAMVRKEDCTAVVRKEDCTAGEVLWVTDDRGELERMTRLVPGITWNPGMAECCGKCGEVVAVLDSFVGMRFEGRISWCFVYGALRRRR